MNKHLKKLLLFSLILAFISTVSFCSAPFVTETAEMIHIRKTVSGEGYIIRNEKVVTPTNKGAFEASVQSGIRVPKGGVLGVVISGNYDEKLVNELKDITARIAEIEASNNFADVYSSDEARIFSALKDMTGTIRSDVRSGNFISAAENATQLNSLLGKTDDVENSGSSADLLSELKSRKYDIEQQLGGLREEIKSPSAGYFYSTLDGMESVVKESGIAALTPTEINSFDKTLESYTPEASSIGKVTDTFVWYLTAVIPTEEADLLTVGKKVKISVDSAPEVSAEVVAINSDSTKKSAIVLKSTLNAKGVFEKRCVSFEICYEEYNGLYIPASAVRVVNGVTGVYVTGRNDSVSFRAIDIILHEESYYIVRSNFTPPEGVSYPALKLYDNVLVNPEVASPNELEE